MGVIQNNWTEIGGILHPPQQACTICERSLISNNPNKPLIRPYQVLVNYTTILSHWFGFVSGGGSCFDNS